MTEPWIWQVVSAALAAGLVIALVLRRPASLPADVAARFDALGLQQERTERGLQQELARGRQEQGGSLRDVREEVGRRLEQLVQTQDRRFEELRTSMAEQLARIRQESATQLDAIKQTVDARLQQTLEERLGSSFRIVSERLEQVHRGLGEMQVLASGVGDLKRVLTNVKVRGTWGEVQLGNLLEQALAPDQYATNVATRSGSDERVDFAVRLPGPEGTPGDFIWLPIDAKFPLEDYQRLVDASERADSAALEVAARELDVRIRTFARRVSEKYIEPPRTTDFAILFLPVEGLYAEILRRPGLVDGLQRDFRMLVAGPTTLWALLNSLRLGFRTLAIQRRSSEVWTLLAAVKGDFARFGMALDAVQKKLGEATSKLDDARKGTRRIERRLDDVQATPAAEAQDSPATPLFDDVAAAEG
ncbi:MAG: DNA recombination protein RmuC [Vicinamibacterales bacterium]